jgi:hypothetical protein
MDDQLKLSLVALLRNGDAGTASGVALFASAGLAQADGPSSVPVAGIPGRSR